MAYEVTLSIPNINCGHCVMTIKRETKDVAGVINVQADQEGRTATFTLENEGALPRVKQTLAEIGYPVQEQD